MARSASAGGGSWNNTIANLRGAYRNGNLPRERNGNIGFRCAMTSHLRAGELVLPAAVASRHGKVRGARRDSSIRHDGCATAVLQRPGHWLPGVAGVVHTSLLGMDLTATACHNTGAGADQRRGFAPSSDYNYKENSMIHRGLGRAFTWAGMVLLVWAVFGPVREAQADPTESRVDTTVTPLGGGMWLYEYEVFNLTGGPLLFNGFGPGFDSGFEERTGHLHFIRDWELPWFRDAGITSITSPYLWAYSIETIGVPNPATGWDGVAAWQIPGDPMYQGPGSPFTTVGEVLHWYTSILFIPPGGSLGGFSFVAVFDETDAPYQASWLEAPVRTGDPGFPMGTPNSPLTGGSVPEPASAVLLALGAAACWCGRRGRGRA